MYWNEGKCFPWAGVCIHTRTELRSESIPFCMPAKGGPLSASKKANFHELERNAHMQVTKEKTNEFLGKVKGWPRDGQGTVKGSQGKGEGHIEVRLQ